VFLVQCSGEMAVKPTVTAVLLHHDSVDIGTDSRSVSTR